jgi:hypothetical protein
MTAFVFCSFWVYHYVDLTVDVHGEGTEDAHQQESAMTELGAAGYRNMLVPFVTSDAKAATPYRQRFEMAEGGHSVS